MRQKATRYIDVLFPVNQKLLDREEVIEALSEFGKSQYNQAVRDCAWRADTYNNMGSQITKVDLLELLKK